MSALLYVVCAAVVIGALQVARWLKCEGDRSWSRHRASMVTFSVSFDATAFMDAVAASVAEMAAVAQYPPLEYYVDPEPEEQAAGVQTGYVVVWSGKPGPASIASAVLATDGTGALFWEITGDFEPTTVVDDDTKGSP